MSQLPLAPQQWRSPRGCRRNVNETTTPKLPPVKAAVDEGSWRLASQVMAHFDTLKESIMGIENTWNNCIHNYQILPKCGEHGKIIYEWVDFPLPCLLERKDNDYQPSDPCFSFPSTWLAKATRCNQDGHPNIDSSCQIDPLKPHLVAFQLSKNLPPPRMAQKSSGWCSFALAFTNSPLANTNSTSTWGWEPESPCGQICAPWVVRCRPTIVGKHGKTMESLLSLKYWLVVYLPL